MRFFRVVMAGMVLLASSLMLSVGNAGAQHRAVAGAATPPEGCVVYGTADPDSPYAFTRDEIQSLAMVNAGEQANLQLLTSSRPPPVRDIAKTIAGLREELKGNTCAAFLMSDYTGSRDETTANVSKFLVFAYQELGKMSNQMLQIVLQGSLSGAGPSQWEQVANWNKQRERILDEMADALAVSMSALVDESRKDPQGKPDHLILPRSQKDALLRYLLARFPVLVEQKTLEHSGPFVSQASLIQSYLAGAYQPADAP